MNQHAKRALLALRDTMYGAVPLMLSTVAVIFSLSACIDGMVTRALIEFYADPPIYQDIVPEYKQANYQLVQDTGGPAPAFQMATVIRVVDGDTIKVRLNALEERSVRLIGVDTPETVHPRRPVECFGPEASEYLTELLPPGKQVLLGYEGKIADAYGRLVAYVWLPWISHKNPDGSTSFKAVLLNVKLVYEGYGRAYTKYPFEYKNLFVEAERQAKEARRGLWSACPEA